MTALLALRQKWGVFAKKLRSSSHFITHRFRVADALHDDALYRENPLWWQNLSSPSFQKPPWGSFSFLWFGYEWILPYSDIWFHWYIKHCMHADDDSLNEGGTFILIQFGHVTRNIHVNSFALFHVFHNDVTIHFAPFRGCSFCIGSRHLNDGMQKLFEDDDVNTPGPTRSTSLAAVTKATNR